MENETCGYFEIRSSFLVNCYSCCRNKVVSGGAWIENETAAACAYEEMDGAYFEDIELLMVEVIAIVAGVGGMSAPSRECHQGRAKDVLDRLGEDGLLQHLQGEELNAFRHDLSLVGLLVPQPHSQPAPSCYQEENLLQDADGMNADRYGYARLCEEFVGLTYEYCRAKTKGTKGWVSGETAAGFARDQFDDVFDTDIEKPMLEVLFLVSAAGRDQPDIRRLAMSRAKVLIARVGATNFGGVLGEDDASELGYDHEILGLTSGE